MSLSVVLYAEGPAEDRGALNWLPAPGETLQPEMLGPAHRLLTRLIAQDHSIPRPAVQFVSPLMVGPRAHRGSDLHTIKTLRKLLTFAAPTRRPQLAVVVVDEDAEPDRRRTLLAGCDDLDLPRVIAVCIREFEAWLIADSRALVKVLGVTETPAAPESMRVGEAKQLLQRWMAAAPTAATPSPSTDHALPLRTALAEQVELNVLDRLSAFRAFRNDLRAALRPA